MKLWAKVKFKKEENAQELIRAFFNEFNPESSIVIKGNNAKMEIYFNESPVRIAEAISNCEVLELYYGKNLDEYQPDDFEEPKKAIDQTENSEQVANTVVEEENSEKTEPVVVEETVVAGADEHPKKKRGRTTKKAETAKIVSTENLKLPELEEIAKKAVSYEHFVKLVSEWLEMDKQKEFFENLLIVAPEVDKLSWKDLEAKLKDKGMVFGSWSKIWTSNQLTKKLEKYSLTMLPFLQVIVQYKQYSFGNEQPKEENGTEQVAEETVETVIEESSVEVVNPKNRVKMECMPEIPHFEEILGSVDKSQPIEDRVRYVLTVMGWDKLNAQERQGIFKITNTAVRMREIDLDVVFFKINISSTKESKFLRLSFAKFIDDFVNKYDSSKQVKVLDFLKQLQGVIMQKNEIEGF